MANALLDKLSCMQTDLVRTFYFSNDLKLFAVGNGHVLDTTRTQTQQQPPTVTFKDKVSSYTSLNIS